MRDCPRCGKQRSEASFRNANYYNARLKVCAYYRRKITLEPGRKKRKLCVTCGVQPRGSGQECNACAAKRRARRGYRCISGDDAMPRDTILPPGAFRHGLREGTWEPGSVWEFQGERYEVVGFSGLGEMAVRA